MAYGTAVEECRYGLMQATVIHGDRMLDIARTYDERLRGADVSTEHILDAAGTAIAAVESVCRTTNRRIGSDVDPVAGQVVALARNIYWQRADGPLELPFAIGLGGYAIRRGHRVNDALRLLDLEPESELAEAVKITLFRQVLRSTDALRQTPLNLRRNVQPLLARAIGDDMVLLGALDAYGDMTTLRHLRNAAQTVDRLEAYWDDWTAHDGSSSEREGRRNALRCALDRRIAEEVQKRLKSPSISETIYAANILDMHGSRPLNTSLMPTIETKGQKLVDDELSRKLHARDRLSVLMEVLQQDDTDTVPGLVRLDSYTEQLQRAKMLRSDQEVLYVQHMRYVGLDAASDDWVYTGIGSVDLLRTSSKDCPYLLRIGWVDPGDDTALNVNERGMRPIGNAYYANWQTGELCFVRGEYVDGEPHWLAAKTSLCSAAGYEFVNSKLEEAIAGGTVGRVGLT